MSAVSIIGPKFYAYDADGNPLAFGKVYTYQAGTNNPKTTYTAEDAITANANPVILNGEGYANIYLDGAYKIVVKDKDENERWTSDPVTSAQADEWVQCLTTTYLSPTSFKVPGNHTATYEVGRRVRIDNNVASYSFSTVVSIAFSAGESTITVLDAVVITGVIGVCRSVIGPDSIAPSAATDLRYSPTFATVAAMTAATPLALDGSAVTFTVGMVVRTGGYRDGWAAFKDPIGAGDYDVATLASVQAVRGGGWVPDEKGDFTLFGGLIAVLKGSKHHVAQYGASPLLAANETFLQAAINAAKLATNSILEFDNGQYTVGAVVNFHGNFGANGILIQGNNATIIGTHAGLVVDIDQSVTGPAENWRMNLRVHDLNVTAAGKGTAGTRCVSVAAVTDAVQVTADVEWRGGVFRGGATGLLLDRAITDKFSDITIRDCGLAISSPDISNLLTFTRFRLVNNDRAGYFNNFGLSVIDFISCEFEANGFSGNATDGIKSLEFTDAGQVNFFGGHMENSNSQYNIHFDGATASSPTINAYGVEWISGAGDVVHIVKGVLNAFGGFISRGAAVNNIYLSDATFAFANLMSCETSVAGQTQNATMFGKKGMKVGNVSNTAASYALQTDGVSNVVFAKGGFTKQVHQSAAGLEAFKIEVRDTTAGNNTQIGCEEASSILRFRAAANFIAECTNDGANRFRPFGDNTTTCGDGSHRWSVVYAATGTINTSDERTKTELLPIDEVEKLVALEIKAGLRKFKFIDSVNEKGDAARIHFGVGAQTVMDVFKAHGLNPNDYALFCFDEWDAKPAEIESWDASPATIEEWDESPAVVNGLGEIIAEIVPAGSKVISEAVPAGSKITVQAVEAGNRYGIRYDELLCFIIAAM